MCTNASLLLPGRLPCSTATNPFETPALRRQQEEESGAAAFAPAGGAAGALLRAAGPGAGGAAAKAAQKQELLQAVQGDEYQDEELDPEWSQLLGDLDGRLQVGWNLSGAPVARAEAGLGKLPAGTATAVAPCGYVEESGTRQTAAGDGLPLPGWPAARYLVFVSDLVRLFCPLQCKTAEGTQRSPACGGYSPPVLDCVRIWRDGQFAPGLGDAWFVKDADG